MIKPRLPHRPDRDPSVACPGTHGTAELDGGEPTTGHIPARLLDPPQTPTLPLARRRTLTFSTGLSGRDGLGVLGYIDDKLFDPGRIDQQVEGAPWRSGPSATPT